MKTILKCENVCKSFGKKKVIDNVSFEVNKKDITAFIGPNGSGKTTLIKLILSLGKFDSGKIFINGFDIKKDYKKAIEKVGAIVENPDSYLSLTGRENLKLVANMHKNIKESDIDEIISLVGLESRIDDCVKKYSLGMRQRLGIAKALINKPSLLILDEPTNGLDPKGIYELKNLIVKLSQNDIGVLISSHNLTELETFCTKYCIIKKGKIIKTGNIANESDNDLYEFFVNSTKNIRINEIMNVTANSFCARLKENDVNEFLLKLIKCNVKILSFGLKKVSLESAFLEKTGG